MYIHTYTYICILICMYMCTCCRARSAHNFLITSWIRYAGGMMRDCPAVVSYVSYSFLLSVRITIWHCMSTCDMYPTLCCQRYVCAFARIYVFVKRYWLSHLTPDLRCTFNGQWHVAHTRLISTIASCLDSGKKIDSYTCWVFTNPFADRLFSSKNRIISR